MRETGRTRPAENLGAAFLAHRRRLGKAALRLVFLTGLALAVAAAGAWWMAVGGRPDVEDAVAAPRLPRINPDYSQVVLPPNIAPLNFAIREPGRRFFVRIRSEIGEPIEIVSRSPEIAIPRPRWRAMLEANRGKPLHWDIHAEVDGRWNRYQSIVNEIADDAIDPYLVYRLVGPIHNRWRQTAIHQRDLTGFRTSVVLDGQSLDRGCVNCHTFPGNDPRRMLVGVRSRTLGHGTLLSDGTAAEKLATPFGYTAWHPSGRVAVYSVNKVRQFFHAAGPEVRDVVDVDAGLAYCRIDERESKRVPRGADEDRLATYPAWSPDGRWLYYCSAPFLWSDRKAWPPERYAEVKYSLMRVAYDVEADRWGEPEVFLSAEKTGLSILMPRISPDGAFLVFCMCRYGCFPAYQPTSDLYLMNLADRSYRKLEINSEFSEAYHSWSSNSRWIAFSSKRQGGFFTRCYLSYVDKTGRAHKPFVVPQQDPAFYDGLVKNLCVPELVTGPVRAPESVLARAARSPGAGDAHGGAGPRGEALEPWQQAGR